MPRSAVRRTAHSHARCTDGPADRRAWHAARGAEAADELIAAQLDAVGQVARARTGYVEAAAVFEEAARLSPGQEQRAARLLASATLWLMGGRRERALAVLARLSQLPLDPVSALRARQLEGRALLYSGDLLGAYTKLTDAARIIEPINRELASVTLAEATFTCHAGGLVKLAAETADAAYQLAHGSEAAMLVATVALAGTSYIAGEQSSALRLLDTVWPASRTERPSWRRAPRSDARPHDGLCRAVR